MPNSGQFPNQRFEAHDGTTICSRCESEPELGGIPLRHDLVRVSRLETTIGDAPYMHIVGLFAMP